MINLERLSNLSKEQRVVIKILYRIEKVRDKGKEDIDDRDIDIGEELWFGLYRIIEIYEYKVSDEVYRSYIEVSNNPIYRREVIDIVSIMNEEVYDRLVGDI